MCFVYSSTPPSEYEQLTRSVRIRGAVTSIRLEKRFWNILEELASKEGFTLGQFLSTLYDEATSHHGEIANFASLLRVVSTTYLSGAGNSAKAANE